MSSRQSTQHSKNCSRCSLKLDSNACRALVRDYEPLPCEGEGFPIEDRNESLITYSAAARRLNTSIGKVRVIVERSDVERVNAYEPPNERHPGNGTWTIMLRREHVERLTA